MTRTCKKLTGTMFLMLTMLFGLLIVNPAPITAFAEETKLTLNMQSLVLGTTGFKVGSISGKISGDTSSKYYVYAVPDDDKFVSVQDGYTMTSNTFSLKLTAKKVGQTYVKLAIKDTKTSKVVASEYIQVTVKNLNLNNMIIDLVDFKNAGVSGNTCNGLVQVRDLPAGVCYSFKCSLKNSNGTVAVEWQGKAASSRWGTNSLLVKKKCTMYFLKPGDQTVTVSVCDSAGNVVKSKSFDLKVSFSIMDNAENYTRNVNLSESSDFILRPRISTMSLKHTTTYSLPKSITAKDVNTGDWVFTATEPGVYKIPVYTKVSYKDKWYEVGRITYTINVTQGAAATTPQQTDVTQLPDIPGTSLPTIVTTSTTAAQSDVATWDLTLAVGETLSLEDLVDEDTTFRSADPAIATVDAQGLITAVKAGKTVISVYVFGRREAVRFNLTVIGTVETTSTTVTTSTSSAASESEPLPECAEYGMALYVGESYSLKEICDSFDMAIADNEDVVAVSEDGEISAVSEGEALVAMSNQGELVCLLYVTVTENSEEEETENYELELIAGEEFELGEEEGLQYVSEDEEIAYIIDNAYIVAAAPGKTKINALDGDDVLYTIELTVIEDEDADSDDDEYDYIMCVGEDTSLEEFYEAGYTAISSDPAIASVTEDHRLVAHKEGVITLTFQQDGETGLQFKLLVTPKDEESITTAPAETTTGTTTETTATTTETTTTTPEPKGTKGDVNGDGTVNLKDVVLLRRYIASGWGVTLDETIADVNGDGKVNLKDAVMLRRFIAGGWGIAL